MQRTANDCRGASLQAGVEIVTGVSKLCGEIAEKEANPGSAGHSPEGTV